MQVGVKEIISQHKAVMRNDRPTEGWGVNDNTKRVSARNWQNLSRLIEKPNVGAPCCELPMDGGVTGPR